MHAENSQSSGIIRVGLADPYPVVLAGLRSLLQRAPEIDIVGEASQPRQAVALLRETTPDVAVIDPAISGPANLDFLTDLVARNPRVKLLLLTSSEDDGYLRRLLKTGAHGIALKRSPPDEIARAVRVVAAGDMHVDPAIARPLLRANGIATIAELSLREETILKLIARGYSNKEAAAELRLSVKSIETYRARGAKKLQLRRRADIVRYGTAHGWLAAS